MTNLCVYTQHQLVSLITKTISCIEVAIIDMVIIWVYGRYHRPTSSGKETRKLHAMSSQKSEVKLNIKHFVLAYGNVGGKILVFHHAVMAKRGAPHVRLTLSLQFEVSQAKSRHTSPAEIQLLLTRRKRWIFNKREVILTLDPYLVNRTHDSNLERGTCKGPYQQHTRSEMRLEPAIYTN